MFRKAALALSVASISVTSASALDLGLGGVEASVDVGRSGIEADANVGIGKKDVDASLSVGGHGAGASVSMGTGSPTGTGPGIGTGPAGVVVGPDGVVVPAGALLAAGQYQLLVGHWLYSSDGERLGQITQFRGYDGQWVNLVVQLDPALGLGERLVSCSVSRRATNSERVETRMSAFRFVQHIQSAL